MSRALAPQGRLQQPQQQQPQPEQPQPPSPGAAPGSGAVALAQQGGAPTQNLAAVRAWPNTEVGMGAVEQRAQLVGARRTPKPGQLCSCVVEPASTGLLVAIRAPFTVTHACTCPPPQPQTPVQPTHASPGAHV